MRTPTSIKDTAKGNLGSYSKKPLCIHYRTTVNYCVVYIQIILNLFNNNEEIIIIN